MKEPDGPPDTRPGGRAKAHGGSSRPPSPAAFAGHGIQLVVTILLGVYGGRWLDEKLHTGPWLLVAGAFLGAGAAFYGMYRALTAAARAPRDATREPGRDDRSER